ncbi:hypothetical protein AAF712_013624 [Marasmius tenuissimus]|uniref:Uncharacterized protein n=1 Tax=Marasmius tenuissimus TaxID=585030 RepID=A0ABR2ZD67_9AGAR
MDVGPYWNTSDYERFRDYLHKKGYANDGTRYARDNGYPELVLGSPHDGKIEELIDSEPKQVKSPPLRRQSFSSPISSFDMSHAIGSDGTSDSSSSPTTWNEEGFGTGKRKEREHSSNSGPAKRVKLTPSDEQSQQESFGETNWVAQPPRLLGMHDPNVCEGIDSNVGRISEWDQKKFEFRTFHGDELKWHDSHIRPNDSDSGRGHDMQWSSGFLGWLFGRH